MKRKAAHIDSAFEPDDSSNRGSSPQIFMLVPSSATLDLTYSLAGTKLTYKPNARLKPGAGLKEHLQRRVL